MANTFRKIYKKTGNSGSSSDYQLVGNVGVNGVELDIMKGATSGADGEIGLVPKPVMGQESGYVLAGNGTFSSLNEMIKNDTSFGPLEHRNGTGCDVFFNDVIVIIHVRALLTNPQHDQFTDKIILPEGIYAYQHRAVFLIFPLMDEYWRPLEKDIYLSFSNRVGNGDYRNAKTMFRDSVSFTGKCEAVATLVFDRESFSIDNGPGTVA